METSSQKHEATAWLGSEGTKEHYANFDWLRLLMAIQVVAIHSGVTSSVFMNPVPAFLAISGFVVLGSMERRPIGQFFISRALRVLPLLAVSFIAVGALKGGDAMLKNILYWLWPSGQAPVNAVVWSLMYEEVLYILLACLFLLGVYKKKILPLLICALILLTEIYVTNVMPPRLWYFLGGAFFIGNVMYMHKHLVVRFVNKWVAMVIFIVAIYFSHNMPYDAIIRSGFTDFISFAAMIVFAIAGPKLPRLKVDISYSLYLLHCIVREQFWGVIGFGTLEFFGAVLFSTIPLCFLAWYVIEKPALSLKGRLSPTLGRVNT